MARCSHFIICFCFVLFFVQTEPPILLQGSINVTRKDIECGTQNAVTYEWASPTNIMMTGLSHYEIKLKSNSNNIVQEINVTYATVIFILDDGTYSINVTAVNRCGERSETITSVNDEINNRAAGCTATGTRLSTMYTKIIQMLQGGVGGAFVVAFILGCIATSICCYCWKRRRHIKQYIKKLC